MITTSDVVHWSLARAANHALSQPLEIDVDPDDDVPIAAEVSELVIVWGVGQGRTEMPYVEASLFEAHALYSGHIELTNLVIWTPDVGPETLPRLEPSAAFHELDALRSDVRPALQAIHRLNATRLPYRDRLAARLEDLLRAYQEEYDGRSLSGSAINIFVNFMNAHPQLKRPRLSATPFGDLYAEWTAPTDMLFGVRFTPSGEVQYVVFTPNPLHKDRTDRSSGTTTADVLMEKIDHLRDHGWLVE